MLFLKVIMLTFALVFGIANQIIDYRHRKKKAYAPGDEWAYYSRLCKEGSLEGKFMMCSAYCAIGCVVIVLAYLAIHLFSA